MDSLNNRSQISQSGNHHYYADHNKHNEIIAQSLKSSVEHVFLLIIEITSLYKMCHLMPKQFP